MTLSDIKALAEGLTPAIRDLVDDELRAHGVIKARSFNGRAFGEEVASIVTDYLKRHTAGQEARLKRLEQLAQLQHAATEQLSKGIRR